MWAFSGYSALLAIPKGSSTSTSEELLTADKDPQTIFIADGPKTMSVYETREDRWVLVEKRRCNYVSHIHLMQLCLRP